MMFGKEFERLIAIGGFRNHFHVRLRAHERNQAHPNNVMVVGYQYANLLRFFHVTTTLSVADGD